VAFFIVLCVGYASDLTLNHHPSWRLADEIGLGVAAALVVYAYERQRSRLLAEKVRVIREKCIRAERATDSLCHDECSREVAGAGG